MLNLSSEYKKLVYEGISSQANLADLNDMTDRGQHPLKPFTAGKTVGIMQLIRIHQPQSEDELLNLFQKNSKKSIELITDEVYEHQKIFFGYYKYSKQIIFKYCYCCIVINSLKGNTTEIRFDHWFKQQGFDTAVPEPILDTVFHTDRLLLDTDKHKIQFISIKPASFYHNFEQYVDVFEGLQFLHLHFHRPWIIYYEHRQGHSFSSITYASLSQNMQKHLENPKKYMQSEHLHKKISILPRMSTAVPSL